MAAAAKLAEAEYATDCLALNADIPAAVFPKSVETSASIISAVASAPSAVL